MSGTLKLSGAKRMVVRDMNGGKPFMNGAEIPVSDKEIWEYLKNMSFVNNKGMREQYFSVVSDWSGPGRPRKTAKGDDDSPDVVTTPVKKKKKVASRAKPRSTSGDLSRDEIAVTQ